MFNLSLLFPRYIYSILVRKLAFGTYSTFSSYLENSVCFRRNIDYSAGKYRLLSEHISITCKQPIVTGVKSANWLKG